VKHSSRIQEENLRQAVHNSEARFRVNDGLLFAAEERARREGMSLSEFMRHALRRELQEAS